MGRGCRTSSARDAETHVPCRTARGDPTESTVEPRHAYVQGSTRGNEIVETCEARRSCRAGFEGAQCPVTVAA